MPRRTPISPRARGLRRSAPGPASNRRRWKAAWRSRRRSRSRPRNTPSERCRGRRIGPVTGSRRWSWSSGRIGRTGCTTASSSAASARRAMAQDAALSVSYDLAMWWDLTDGDAASNQPRRALLLTGASRGIGHATVKRFSAAGWRVITCSRHPFPENCPWEMGPEDHIQVDLADPDGTLAPSPRSSSGSRTASCTRWSTMRRSRPRPTAASGCPRSTPRSTSGGTCSG